jgi:anti-anti-sigma factor
MSRNTIAYVCENNLYVLKMNGELRFSLAPSVNEALKCILDNDNITDVIIDLSQAEFIDSTIIGTLLNFFLKEEIWSRFVSNPPRILTNNNDIIKSLVSIGIDMFFPFTGSEPKLKTISHNYTKIEKIAEDKLILEQYVKASHRTLSKLSPRSDFQNIVSHIKH